jgi:hypothetical protein
MSRQLALTGPAAAALWKLDGYRDQSWAPLWCAPANGRPGPDIIRTRLWTPPVDIDGTLVAPVATVLRHLAWPSATVAPGTVTPGTVTPGTLDQLDLAELALEHALRERYITLDKLVARGGNHPGDQLLRKVMDRRPAGEPPTESYAETRAVQRFRSIDQEPWRQVPIINGRSKHRADFLLAYLFSRTRPRRTPMPRPKLTTPSMGVLVEIDSREFHESRFEEDHARELARSTCTQPKPGRG